MGLAASQRPPPPCHLPEPAHTLVRHTHTGETHTHTKYKTQTLLFLCPLSSLSEVCTSGDSVGWRDHISQSSMRQLQRDAHQPPCSTPSDLSGPPTPVHTSSPQRTLDRWDLTTISQEGKGLCEEGEGLCEEGEGFVSRFNISWMKQQCHHNVSI